MPDHDQSLVLDRAEAARRMPGPDYREVLGWIHRHGRPRSYLEIGVKAGASFALAQPGTLAVGVDPAPRPAGPMPGRIFAETSDAFFARPDVRAICAAPVQMAFIDGLHTFDQVLRDFVHVERVAAPDSIVVLHDVHPVRPEVATRERGTVFWTGDVWKAAWILAEERPDLSLAYVPCAPSGLLLVTGVNPADTGLGDRYDALVGAWMTREAPADTSRIVEPFARIENAEASVRAYVAAAWGT